MVWLAKDGLEQAMTDPTAGRLPPESGTDEQEGKIETLSGLSSAPRTCELSATGSSTFEPADICDVRLPDVQGAVVWVTPYSNRAVIRCFPDKPEAFIIPKDAPE